MPGGSPSSGPGETRTVSAARSLAVLRTSRGPRRLGAPFPLFLLTLLLPSGGQHTIAPLVLRLVQGGVGALDQRLRRVAMAWTFRHADADRDLPTGELLDGHPGPDTLRHDCRLSYRGLEQHHQELLPAVSRHAVHAACRFPQDLRDPRERYVARRVAVRVVVLLEMVDVRQQHRERAPQPPRPLHLGRERAHQMPTVVEPGEGIRNGEPLELRLALPLAQARHQRVEHPRQVAHLTNPTTRALA